MVKKVNFAELMAPPTVIPFGTSTIEVRGVALEELASLLTRYKEKVLPFFVSANINYSELLLTAPDMVAEMIAIASDSPGEEPNIKKFPAADQIEALTAIFKMSVPDLGKLEESLSGLVATLTKRKDAANRLPSKSTLRSVSADSASEATPSVRSVDTPS